VLEQNKWNLNVSYMTVNGTLILLLRVPCSVGVGNGIGSGTPPKKKPKRLCNYCADWNAEFNWCLKVAAVSTLNIQIIQ